MKRSQLWTWTQLTLIGSTIMLSWLGMQIVHELGHVLGALVSGGRVDVVVLDPLSISRTDLSLNPHPLLVCWAGAVAGSLLPVMLAGAWRMARAPGMSVIRFFAGFCLIANGCYLGIGSFRDVGDAGDLIVYGASSWQLWAFGAVTVPLGFLFWNGLGSAFGLGSARGNVRRDLAWCTATVTVVLLAGMFVFTNLYGAASE